MGAPIHIDNLISSCPLQLAGYSGFINIDRPKIHILVDYFVQIRGANPTVRFGSSAAPQHVSSSMAANGGKADVQSSAKTMA
jgi:hypothetical protein